MSLTPVDRLKLLVEQIEQCSSIKIKKLEEDDVDVVRVCIAWLSIAVSYGKAICHLLANQLPAAVPPIERALLEIWCETMYLLDHGNKYENAARVQIHAHFDIQATFERNDQPPSQLEPIKRNIELYRKKWPGLVESYETKRRRHWSGLTRTDVIREQPALFEYYNKLSWDAHPIVTSIRDITLAQDKTMLFGIDSSVSEDSADYVGQMLFSLWNKIAEEFGFGKLHPPTS